VDNTQEGSDDDQSVNWTDDSSGVSVTSEQPSDNDRHSRCGKGGFHSCPDNPDNSNSIGEGNEAESCESDGGEILDRHIVGAEVTPSSSNESPAPGEERRGDNDNRVEGEDGSESEDREIRHGLK
jgi:hypothetical protein